MSSFCLVHCPQKTPPQARQWCFRRATLVKGALQPRQTTASMSWTQRVRADDGRGGGGGGVGDSLSSIVPVCCGCCGYVRRRHMVHP